MYISNIKIGRSRKVNSCNSEGISAHLLAQNDDSNFTGIQKEYNFLNLEQFLIVALLELLSEISIALLELVRGIRSLVENIRSSIYEEEYIFF